MDSQRFFALALSFSSRFDEAERLFKLVIFEGEKLFGVESAVTLGFLGQFGQHYVHKKCYREAEEFLNRAYLGNLRRFGPDGPNTLFFCNLLAISIRLQNDFWKIGSAEVMLQKSLNISRMRYGSRHVITLDLTREFGLVLLTRNRYREGKESVGRASRS